MFDEGRISREAGGIETLHLANQTLNVAQGSRLVTIGLAQLIELSHGVLITALEFSLGHGRYGAVRIVGEVLTAYIPRAVVVAPAPPAAIRAAIPIAAGADLVSVTEATVGAALLAALLTATTLLTLTALLPLPTLLALATLLTLAHLALATLTLAWLLTLALLAGAIAGIAVHGFEVLPQALQVIESLLFAARSLSLALTRLSAEGLLCLVHLIVQTLEAFGDSGLGGGRQRPVSLVDPIRAAFQEILQVGIFHSAESVAQLGGCVALRGRERTHGVPHLVLQRSQIRSRLLTVAGKLLLLCG